MDPPPRALYDQVGWALLAVLLLVVVGFVIWWFAVHDRTSKKTVPAVTGMSVAAAVNELQDRGFKVRIVAQPHPERAGTVFRQIPPAGSRLDKGSAVQLLNSSGPSTISVPNAVGLTEADGRDRLVAAGLEVTETRVFADAKPGTIVAQSPAAGSKAAKGAAVRVNVSKGSATVVVPNVVGMSLGEAETQLAKASLKPAVQLRVPSAQPAGAVVAQDPAGRPGQAWLESGPQRLHGQRDRLERSDRGERADRPDGHRLGRELRADHGRGRAAAPAARAAVGAGTRGRRAARPRARARRTAPRRVPTAAAATPTSTSIRAPLPGGSDPHRAHPSARDEEGAPPAGLGRRARRGSAARRAAGRAGRAAR